MEYIKLFLTLCTIFLPDEVLRAIKKELNQNLHASDYFLVRARATKDDEEGSWTKYSALLVNKAYLKDMFT